MASLPGLPEPPEARGPGTEAPGGAVAWGVPAPRGSTTVVPARPPEERERDRAERAARPLCDRCAGVPGEILAPIAAALRAARSEGRPPL
jgi:hypothetical protein